MSDSFIGEIKMFAGSYAPLGWMFCDGSLLSIAENEPLFNLIGTTYGGDGQNTFALPDLRSRVPVHQGGGFALAQKGGEESVTLTINQVAPHSHPARADANAVSAASPAGNVWGNWGAQGKPYTDQAPAVQMSAQAIQPAGGGQPHDNMLPYLAVNFIICLYGIYPTQA